MKIKSRFDDFKSFITKGNVLDLAIGVIIGGAFGKIVSSLVGDVIMPLIGLVVGRINLANLSVTLMPKTVKTAALIFNYGSFLQSIVDFLIISLCIYIFIKIIEKFRRKQEKPVEVVIAPPRTEELLQEIRDLLRDKR